MKKLVLLFVCIGILMSFLGCARDRSDRVELMISHILSTTEDKHISLVEMAQRLYERSNGTFVAHVFPNAEIGGHSDNLAQMVRGANVMGIMSTDFLAPYVPDFAILDGPFLFNDHTEFAKIQDSEWFADASRRLYERGLKLLSIRWYFGARHIASRIPINSPDDLVGLRFRSAPSPGRVLMTSLMGASPIQMSWPETYSALQQGIVEATEAPLSTLFGSRIHEVCPHITLTGHIHSIFSVLVSVSWFNSLSPEHQRLLLEEIDITEKILNERTVNSEARWREMLESEGAIINDRIDREAFRRVTAPFYTEFPEWTPGLYNTIRGILQ